MQAVVQEQYGPPEALRLREVDQPVAGEDEVLVRVRAASVHPDVWHVVTGRPYVLRLMGSGLRRPRQRIPGTDVAGVVEAVGKGVTGFRPGDEIFGETLRGYSWRNGGAFAEYAAIPAGVLAHKPGNVSFEQAAAVPTTGFITLLNLPDRDWLAGKRVLVNGAGGGVGTLAVQIAKAYGAIVTGVDSEGKLELVGSLGADHVVDYTREDFTRGGERYDLIFDIPGNHPFSACRRVLNPDGRYVLIGHDRFGREGRRWLGSLPRFMGLMVRTPFTRQLSMGSSGIDKRTSMAVLADLLAAGKLTPVIDRTSPLAEVPAAIRYLASEDARGRVIVTS